ncbi:hypothetical protein BDV26DRAFT_268002 [Aspergillus bertholletiae]|uniref:RING-type domain-containing protein n=1 Tax=Aspergillus bertholletiae TaxID=1226010 RepID=A0A5N7B038_9EURO|nr:hypothetical protein BDV26DRAFT_268002 [Aspergillus bertholletiae]
MSNESPTGGPGLGDLEKELVCSICTELLYQPLTLLDCLHTFCGSCLKEWFSTQASRRRPSSSVRFTCPSCRAVVRETRPNATVTTLLDMVLTANPDRARPEAEKEEIAQRYKPGQSIFPVASNAESDEEDRRLIEEARELSLRESGPRTREHRSARSSRTRRGESVDRDRRREDDRSRQQREEERAARRHARTALPDASERTRQIEHQSSLRSLLSLSDTETMQEEILRQILEEGLLDDIDMDNLGPAQEEELSERIADAYRRRHMQRSRSQQRDNTQGDAQASNRPRARSQSVQRSQPASGSRGSPAHPPVSRPYLLEPLVPRSGTPGHQRRLSDQGSRRRVSPIPVNSASSSEVNLRPAARSSSDMIADRPRGSQAARVRATDLAPRTRRATASEQSIPNIWVAGSNDRELRRQRQARQSIDTPTSVSSVGRSPRTASFSLRSEQNLVNSPTATTLTPEINSPARPEGRSRPSSSRSNASHVTAYYVEPSISCDRCGKDNLQYELHKKCWLCKGGDYHICLRCYRLGLGCLEWPGFGVSSKADLDRIRASSNGLTAPSQESQHILVSLKYSRPSDAARRTTRDGREATSDNPAQRLQMGLFCDMCQLSTDTCFWKCNQCNEGDWGFCNKCVNEGKCCTHALLPICRITPDGPLSPTTPAVPGDEANGPAAPLASETLKVLSFSTKCDICANQIPASTLRFHCLQCNGGDYDTCANCYLKLVATAKIRKENGHNGWRRCLKGHRMVVIGFEDHEEGQKRVIVRDLVGGRALKDEHLQSSSPPASPSLTRTFLAGSGTVPSPELGTGDWSWKEGAERRKKASRIRAPWSSTLGDRSNSYSEPSTPTTPTPNASSSRRFPPDGGVGLVVHALWSWYPENGVKDELMFPRGAEITEAENINDDWYWGCYAGLTGLFPGTHVFIVEEVA